MDADAADYVPGPSGIHIDTSNGHHQDSELTADGEVSPSSLRRSTRASALKAQEKLKFKDGMSPTSNGVTEGHEENRLDKVFEVEDEEEMDDEPVSKKARLLNGCDLDQYDYKFGVKMVKDEVYIFSDESVISSLNSEEVGDLRKNYEEYKAGRVSKEQQFERDIQVSELEALLRFEEKKLALLKKTIQNRKEAEIDTQRKTKALAEVQARQEQAKNAYKPPMATNPSRVNGSTPKSSSNRARQQANARDHMAGLGLTPENQQALLKRLAANPQLFSGFPAALLNLLPQLANQQRASGSGNANTTTTNTPVVAAAAAPTPPAPAPTVANTAATATPPKREAPSQPTSTPAQRIAEAKRKLRQNLDGQLLSIPAPKALMSDVGFIPNAAPDFCYLLGLDLAVQRVLKDKNVFRKYDDVPYVCEECGTDFTPSWKAIGSSENDLHLYCEACVKQAQKRKMKQDHAGVYKKALARVAEQEKELEKQIAAGKFDDPPAPPPPPPPPVKAPTPAAPKQTTPSIPSNLNAAAGINVAALLMAHQQQATQRRNQTPQQQPSTSAQTSRSQSGQRANRQRSSTQQSSSSSSSSANSNALNLQNQLMMNLMQNPMAAALLANAGTSALWGNLLNQNANNRNNGNNMGTAALSAMMQAAGNVGGANNNNLMHQMLLRNQLQQLAMINPNILQNRTMQQPTSKAKK